MEPWHSHGDALQPHCDGLCLQLSRGDHNLEGYNDLAQELSDKPVWGQDCKLVLGLSSIVVLEWGYKPVFGGSYRMALGGEDGKLVPELVVDVGRLVWELCDKPVLGRDDRRLEQGGGRGQVVGGHYMNCAAHNGGPHGWYTHMRGRLCFYMLVRGWYGADMMGL